MGALTLVALLFLTPVQSQSVFEAMGQEINEIFEAAQPALVRVRSEGDMLTMAGSGFFIDDQGTLLTAAAIVADNGRASVELDGHWVDAKIAGLDRRSGVAMLKVLNDEGGLTPFLQMDTANELKSGAPIVGLGYPRNQPVAPSFGFIGGLDFRYLNRYFPTTHIRANVPVSPGQVGGPLVDKDKKVIGMMVTAIDGGRGVYALPSEAIRKIVEDFRKHGQARHGWVGVGVRPLPPEARSGKMVQIAHLFEDTPAAASGLLPGDVVLRIGGRGIYQPSDVIDASFFSRVGEKLHVAVVRNGKEHTFSFIVRERPVTPPKPMTPEDALLAPAPQPPAKSGGAIPVNAR